MLRQRQYLAEKIVNPPRDMLRLAKGYIGKFRLLAKKLRKSVMRIDTDRDLSNFSDHVDLGMLDRLADHADKAADELQYTMDAIEHHTVRTFNNSLYYAVDELNDYA